MTIDYFKEQSPDAIEAEMSKDSRKQRLHDIVGKYVIMTRIRRGGIVFVIDPTIHSSFKRRYWTNLLCNAKGYDNAQEAYDRIDGITNGACVFKVGRGHKLMEVNKNGNRKR